MEIYQKPHWQPPPVCLVNSEEPLFILTAANRPAWGIASQIPRMVPERRQGRPVCGPLLGGAAESRQLPPGHFQEACHSPPAPLHALGSGLDVAQGHVAVHSFPVRARRWEQPNARHGSRPRLQKCRHPGCRPAVTAAGPFPTDALSGKRTRGHVRGSDRGRQGRGAGSLCAF